MERKLAAEGKAWRCSAAVNAGLSLCPRHHQKKRTMLFSDDWGEPQKRAKALFSEASNLAEIRKRMVKEEKRKTEECDSVVLERNQRKKMRVIKEEEAEELHYVPLTRKGMKKMRVSEDDDSDDEPGRRGMRGRGVWREDSESLVMKKSVCNGLMEISDELRCKRSDGKKWRCGARAMPERIYCEKHYIQISKRQGERERTSKMKKGHNGVASDLLDQKGQGKISENPPQSQQDALEKKQMKGKVRDEEVDVRNYDSEDSERRFEGRKRKIKGGGARKPGNRRIVGGSLMCHQCQRNDKGRVVWCSQCNKRYCVCCIERWYLSNQRRLLMLVHFVVETATVEHAYAEEVFWRK